VGHNDWRSNWKLQLPIIDLRFDSCNRFINDSSRNIWPCDNKISLKAVSLFGNIFLELYFKFSMTSFMVAGFFIAIGIILLLVNSNLWSLTLTASSNNILNTYCEGGFPTYNTLIDSIVSDYNSLQLEYIDKYMCSSFCPCTAVNSSLWGLRAIELASYDFSGSITTFNDCYNSVLLTKGMVPNISSTIINFA